MVVVPRINNHINAFPIPYSRLSWGRLHGSHLHRPSPSSYTYRGLTAGNNDAPTDCRTRTIRPQLVHRQ